MGHHKPGLPGAVGWVWSWQDRAACVGLDAPLFSHPAGEHGLSWQAREDAAKRVCAGCPVLEPCRAYALASREPYGVWGGLSAVERRVLLRARRQTAQAA
ncbi:WhiB family transcriptional regulator [Streptacidiphilus rugosus]|uniref:WhiB family transcriptional regulator n=1 Tax=Streptacidiphilus rugosus TaxID=405783 RepID=UPI000560F166|nr:WhiB family transcriptional regulator [Streptacidiphilus rugosus]